MTETYGSIWKTLSSIDVSKHVEKKQGLSYLSWAWAWGVLMEEFPHAEYDFLPDTVHADGTVTVTCRISIGPCTRVMWLPVMDHRNNAIKHPDARKLSDTRMRTLVKCLAMFGLGHRIYAGEDITATEEKVEQKSEPVVEKKKVPTKDANNDLPTPDAAADAVGKLLEFANKFCTDEPGLIGFWKENKKLIDIIDHNYPEQYAVLKAGFTTLKSKFGGSNA